MLDFEPFFGTNPGCLQTEARVCSGASISVPKKNLTRLREDPGYRPKQKDNAKRNPRSAPQRTSTAEQALPLLLSS